MNTSGTSLQTTLPLRDVDVDLSDPEDIFSDATSSGSLAQAKSESLEGQTDRNIYSGLAEKLKPFSVYAYPITSTNYKQREQLLRQTTILFYHRSLYQKSDLNLENRLESCPSQICRICRQGESTEDFFSPCRCKGTIAVVHLSCLERWLAESDSSICELCGHHYTTVRIPRYGVLESLKVFVMHMRRRILCDIIAFCSFAPLAAISTYLGFVTADSYYDVSWDWDLDYSIRPICTRVISICTICMLSCLDTLFVLVVFLRVQNYITNWYSWWRRNSVVRVVLPPENLTEDSSSYETEDSETEESSYDDDLH